MSTTRQSLFLWIPLPSLGVRFNLSTGAGFRSRQLEIVTHRMLFILIALLL